MATKKWYELFAEKLEEAVGEIDEDELLEAIKGNLDVEALVQELMQEDEEFKAKANAKVRELLIKEIEGCKTLAELNGEDLCLSDVTDENNKSLINQMTRQLLKSDEVIAESLKSKLRKILTAKIKSLDEDDVFGEDSQGNDFNFADLFDRDAQFKALLASDEMQQLLNDALKKLITEHIEGQELNDEDIPEDEMKELIEKSIKTLLADPEIVAKVQAKIAEELESTILQKIADEDTLSEALDEKLKTDPRMEQLVANEVESLMRDRDFIDKISQQIKTRLTRDASGFSSMLLDRMVSQVAELLVSKLFESKR